MAQSVRQSRVSNLTVVPSVAPEMPESIPSAVAESVALGQDVPVAESVAESRPEALGQDAPESLQDGAGATEAVAGQDVPVAGQDGAGATVALGQDAATDDAACPEDSLTGEPLAHMARQMGIDVPNLHSLAARKPGRVRDYIKDAREEAVFTVTAKMAGPLERAISAVQAMQGQVALGKMPSFALTENFRDAYVSIMTAADAVVTVGHGAPAATTTTRKSPTTKSATGGKQTPEVDKMTLPELQARWVTGVANRLTQQVPKSVGLKNVAALWAALPEDLHYLPAAAAYLGWTIPVRYVASLPKEKQALVALAAELRPRAIAEGKFTLLDGTTIRPKSETFPNLPNIDEYPTVLPQQNAAYFAGLALGTGIASPSPEQAPEQAPESAPEPTDAELATVAAEETATA